MDICVRVSVRPYAATTKSVITFGSLDKSPQNFQHPLNSLQVIFGQVIWTQGPQGQAPTSKSGFCAKSISSQGFGAGGWCHTFSEKVDAAKNVQIQFFIFGPRPKKMGLAGGAGQWDAKILKFEFFPLTFPPIFLPVFAFIFAPSGFHNWG